MIIVRSLSFCLMVFMTGCIHNKMFFSPISQVMHIPLFIEMPENIRVFDDIAVLLYDALYHHCVQSGYTIQDSDSGAYTIKIILTNMEQQPKYISSDVILMHYSVSLTIDCIVYDKEKNNILKKSFSHSCLISKMQDPVLTSDAIYYTYKRFVQQYATLIERYIRPYLIKSYIQ